MVAVFAVPVFFICFRECVECSIIVSVLLAFLKQTLGHEENQNIRKRLVRQIWWGVGIGFVICLIVGGGMIGGFYALGKDTFGKTEDLWEGSFAILASFIISLMGAALLRVSKLQDKWRVKIAKAVEVKDSRHKKAKGNFNRWMEKYAMFILPFITVLREGLEAVVFIGGVGVGQPASAFPLAVICGLGAGILVGYLIYRGGNMAALQIFLVISTCFLYLVAAGLFSRAVWLFQNHQWTKITGSDVAELGSGAGSYNIRQSVWHVNCCNPEINGGGGWGIFNSVFGWTNSATYGSVISYNVYWVAVIVGFATMRYNETTGHWPFMKAKTAKIGETEMTGARSDDSGSEVAGELVEKTEQDLKATTTAIREISE